MKPEKHAFLVSVLGAERTKRLLDALPAMEKALMDAGIAWKQVADLELDALRAVCSGPGCATASKADGEEGVVIAAPGLAGATTFAAADQFTEAAALEVAAEVEIETFRALLDNIFSDVDLAMGEKLERVQATASDLAERLGSVGEKAVTTGQKDAARPPAAGYVDDLCAASGVKALDAETAQAVKSLQASPQPATGIVAALLAGGAIQS